MPAFKLDVALATWRRSLEHNRAFTRDDLDELEEHIRDEVDALMDEGLDEERAFRQVIRRMGNYATAEAEYRKVRWGKLRRAHQLGNELRWSTSMLKNYLKIALRTLKRHKAYAFINVLGLAVGVACCLMIGLYVWHERGYDNFHEKADRLYRLAYSERLGRDLPPPAPDELRVWGSAAIAPLLEADLPEVERTVRVSGQHTLLLGRGDRSFQEERYFYADSSFFQVFSFPLLIGDPATALAQPGSIVLAESAAGRYFGTTDPVGQSLLLENDRPVTVTGVMADPPLSSHLDFDILLSMATFEQVAPDYMFQSWGYVDFFTYVLLREGASEEAVEAKLPAFVDRQIGDQMQDPPRSYDLTLESIEEAYLSPIGGRQTGRKGSASNLYLFGFIGAFVLLIAVINFMNLATARSAGRAKEVGVRKVVGARRNGLIGQFLMEAILLVFVAAALGFLLANLGLPLFRNLSGLALPGDALRTPWMAGLLVLGSVGVGLLAGSYPAFVLSAFKPVQVFKGAFATSRHGVTLREALVVFQFATAVVLIAGTLVVWNQLDFLRSRPLGFDKEQQLVLDFGGDAEVLGQVETLKHELEAHPAVRNATATRSIPGGYFPHANTFVEAPDGTMQEFVPGLFEVDFDFLPQLDVSMAAGRPFDRAFGTDSTQALILNEAASATPIRPRPSASGLRSGGGRAR